MYGLDQHNEINSLNIWVIRFLSLESDWSITTSKPVSENEKPEGPQLGRLCFLRRGADRQQLAGFRHSLIGRVMTGRG